MTKGEAPGPCGPPNSLHKRIASEAKAKAYSLVKQAMPSLITFPGMGKSTASSSQGPQAPLLPTMSAASREQATQQSQDHWPLAADQSSDSDNTIPYEDPNEQIHESGGHAAFMDRKSYVQAVVSDDSMSHVTETARPKEGAITLTIEQESDSSGNTEFYEDPTQQDAIRDAAVKGSRDVPTTQGPVAMPPDERTHQPTLVMASPMGDQSLIASPQARMPPRLASPQLSQHSHEERVPDGYVQRQVAEREIQLIQQRYAHEAMSRSREADEMARGWAAMQQQQHLLAERLRDCEKELDRFRR